MKWHGRKDSACLARSVGGVKWELTVLDLAASGLQRVVNIFVYFEW